MINYGKTGVLKVMVLSLSCDHCTVNMIIFPIIAKYQDKYIIKRTIVAFKDTPCDHNVACVSIKFKVRWRHEACVIETCAKTCSEMSTKDGIYMIIIAI